MPHLIDELLPRLQQRGHKPILQFRSNRQIVSWSHLELLAKLVQVSTSLQRAGVRPRQRIALIAKNSPSWILHDLAILMLNGVTVTIHPALPISMQIQQISDAGCQFILQEQNQQLLLGTPEDWQIPVDISRQRLPNPENLATILYTSGTTAEPKGVMLTHDSLFACATTVQAILPFAPNGTVLNVLPFAHIYARSSDLYQCLFAGTTLALGSPQTLEQDIADFQPTNMHAVPYLYERLAKQRTPAELRELFGAKVDWLKAGGAPVSQELVEYYQAAGLLLLQGYGMTECSPVIATQTKQQHTPGSVGPMVPGMQANIIDGQLHVQGQHLFAGYWPNVRENDWFPTGDLAEWTNQQELKILGRVTETLVLSNGRKLQPQRIESVLQQHPAITQAFVTARENHPYPVALLYTSESITSERLLELQQELAPWERIQHFALLPQPLSIEAGELTASLKLRRKVIVLRYQSLLDRLFAM